MAREPYLAADDAFQAIDYLIEARLQSTDPDAANQERKVQFARNAFIRAMMTLFDDDALTRRVLEELKKMEYRARG